MPDYDPYSILYADEPTAKEMALARAQALRGQNFAGLVGSLAHDPQAAHSGQALMQQAQSGLEQLGQDPMQRARLGLEQEQLQKAQTTRQAIAGGPGTTLLRALGKQYVPELGGAIDQAPPEVLNELMPKLESYGAQRMTAEQRALTARLLAGMGPGGSAVPQSVLDQGAEYYNRTGQMPAWVKGRSAAVFGRQIAERATAMQPEADIAANKAGYTGDTSSLKKLQTSADSMDAFETTALRNLKLFQQAAHEAIDTGSPFFNRPLRQFMDKAAGDPKMARFNTLRQTAVQESGKVLGGAVAGGAISDSQRHEVEGLLRGDMTLPQIDASIEALEQDMANRKEATHGQLAEIRTRLSGHAPSKQAPAPPVAAAPPAVDPAVIAHYKSKLQPGERLAINAQGKAKALAASDAVPPGFTEVPLGP